MKQLQAYVDQKNAMRKIFNQPLLTISVKNKQELIDHLECDLSPENLCCDGEAPAHVVRKNARLYNAALTQAKKLGDKPQAPKRTKAPSKSNGKSKADQAKAIFATMAGKSRKEIIETFMTQLNMSKAGASTYYYNCKK